MTERSLNQETWDKKVVAQNQTSATPEPEYL